jgi:hypothetical protein
MAVQKSDLASTLQHDFPFCSAQSCKESCKVLRRRQPDGTFLAPRSLVATLKRREVERVGRDMAGARGLTFLPVQAGEYVSGKLVGSINLVSGGASP